MKLNCFLLFAFLSCVYQVSFCEPSLINFIEDAEKMKQFVSQVRDQVLTIAQLKSKMAEANVSRQVDAVLSEASERLRPLHPICTKPAQEKLRALRSLYQQKITGCNIYQQIKDQLYIVETDVDKTVKVIMDNVIGVVASTADCFHSNSPLTCIAGKALPALEEDGENVWNSYIQILKLLFDGTAALTSCVGGCIISSSVESIVTQAVQCHTATN